MISYIAALLSGLVFGLGLILSGMGNPAKVQNFLDFFGQWDPSLALVMGGAIAVLVLLGICFPLVGASMLVIWLLDCLFFSRRTAVAPAN